MNYKNYIDSIDNFPKKGIIYKDIQPILENNKIFQSAIEDMGELIKTPPDYWVGIESRGFIFASALSILLGGGIKLIRKKGKLPNANLISISYDLEYGSDTIEMKKGKGNVIIVDDILATGGTLKASTDLCIKSGYDVINTLCLMNIGILKNHNTKCLINY